MKSFYHKNIKIICNKILPPKGFKLIALFGTVWTRKALEVMKRYVQTYAGKKSMNHENIHVLQEKKLPLWWLSYYAVYLWWWFKLWIVTFDNKLAYKTIPFEIEAYENETNFDYSESHWEKYKMSNKERKEYYGTKYGK